MNKYYPLTLLLIASAFGCANKVKQEKQVPPHIAKEIAFVEKKIASLNAERTQQKVALYKDVRNKTIALQEKVSKNK